VRGRRGYVRRASLDAREHDACFADVAKAGLRIAIKAALDQPSQSRRRAGRQRRPIDVLPQHGRQDIGHFLALKGPAAGDHFVQHDAERPHVGAPVHGLTSRLFGSHVGGRADDHAQRGPACPVVA
jgi:hypothetical protein